MRSRWLRILSLAFFCVHFSGCSTMFGRQHDDETVTFDANVQNTKIVCSGKVTNTPGSIPLQQSKKHTCTAEAEGYQKKVFQIKSGASWSGFGHSTGTNAACWGWWTLGIGIGIGWIVDGVSGAMRNLKEQNIYLEMQPNSGNSAPITASPATSGKKPATIV